MATTRILDELQRPVDEAKLEISAAILKLLAALPTGISLESVVIHLDKAETVGGQKTTILNGIFVALEL